MPRYAILIRNRRPDWDDKSPDEKQRILERYFGWIDGLVERGALVESKALRDGGRVIEVVEGAVVDGPYTESKEVVGGFFVIDMADLDAARDVACACPALEIGDRVELRCVSDVTAWRPGDG